MKQPAKMGGRPCKLHLNRKTEAWAGVCSQTGYSEERVRYTCLDCGEVWYDDEPTPEGLIRAVMTCD